MKQDVTGYKLQLKIIVCMLINYKFRILTLEFLISILNYKFCMSTRGVVSVWVQNKLQKKNIHNQNV